MVVRERAMSCVELGEAPTEAGGLAMEAEGIGDPATTAANGVSPRGQG